MEKSQRVAFDINKVTIGTRVVTRDGHSGRIDSIDLEKLDYPVSAIIELNGKEIPFIFTKEGRSHSDYTDSIFDLFLEEEEIENQESIQSEKQDKNEIDNYNPYKTTVESIADMVERYSELQTLEELKHFYNNVKVKCREAIEYDSTWNKKQGEKPADNKPEFQEGDWVIDGLGIVHQIIRVVENLGSHTYGYGTDDGFYIHDSKSGVRLWNINDAKDGDVLVSKSGENILIFKQIESITSFSSYYNTLGMSNIGFAKDLFQPATKEQCNLLFQKMKEAGYKWDNKYKELKKINKENKELKQINKEVKTRLMTNQELSWWLRESPEEHREYSYKGEFYILFDYYYNIDDANKEVNESVRIRKNGGEWIIPFINV